jgi:hypothetical protein
MHVRAMLYCSASSTCKMLDSPESEQEPLLTMNLLVWADTFAVLLLLLHAAQSLG